MSRRRLRALTWAGLAVVLVCATVNLTRWPVPWYDEGIHLHVPKALVKFGAYADYSSEGLRPFGPTLAVGPTVMLPIAAAFKLFGVGLLQARVVMAAYLVAFMVAFYLLGRRLGGPVLALAAALLVLSSPGPSVIEYGRQGLGEVAGGFFLATGLYVWFSVWRHPSIGPLVAAGILLGLATATKHVYLLALGPALLTAWILNLVYYRTLPQYVFLVPGAICAAIFGVWQLAVLAWLSPGSLAENWALLRQTSDGAAFVFSPATSRQSLMELMGVNGYFGMLLPALAYSAWRARRRTLPDQMWGVVWLIAAANLGWYVLASLGWMRYAFVGLILAALLVARLWRDLIRAVRQAHAAGHPRAASLAVALQLWLAAVVALPLAGTGAKLIRVPPADAPAIAAWLRANVPEATVVETWEPELGVLTDHRYHYPPPAMLIHAVAHIARGGPSPATRYAFRDGGPPEYVVVGAFARWVGLYGDADLQADYRPAHQEGPYTVWKRVDPADTSRR
jgi:4-amino-4-deoxy-L-arabinose transferase-like glycosyltransferase